jgi:hypothetical protein
VEKKEKIPIRRIKHAEMSSQAAAAAAAGELVLLLLLYNCWAFFYEANGFPSRNFVSR